MAFIPVHCLHFFERLANIAKDYELGKCLFKFPSAIEQPLHPSHPHPQPIPLERFTIRYSRRPT